MNPQFAQEFADEWIAAWNAHDLPRVLRLYCDDFTMQSPYIAIIADEASGRLQGKDAVGAYWQAALARMPELRFELLAVLSGVDSLVVHYRSAGAKLAAEYFEFDAAGKVRRAAAHYA